METARIWEMAKFSNHQLILTELNISALMFFAKLFQILGLLENVAIVSKFSIVKEILRMEVGTGVGTMSATVLLVQTWAGNLLLKPTLKQVRMENGFQKN